LMTLSEKTLSLLERFDLRAGQGRGGKCYLKRAPGKFEERLEPFLRVRKVRAIVGKVPLEERCLRVEAGGILAGLGGLARDIGEDDDVPDRQDGFSFICTGGMTKERCPLDLLPDLVPALPGLNVWAGLRFLPLLRAEDEGGRAGRNDIAELPVLHLEDEETDAWEKQGEVDLFSADADGVPPDDVGARFEEDFH
jgi:hypothetical protein